MSGPTLESALRKTNTRAAFVTLAAAVWRGVAIGVAAVLIAVALDAWLALLPAALIAVDVLLVAMLAWGLLHFVRVMGSQRFEPRRVARLIETRQGIGDSRLINAVEFAAQPAGGASPALVAAAIDEGRTAAATIDSSRVVDSKPARRAAIVALAALLVFGLGVLLAPRVFRAVVPRYLEPLADHPPFTRLRFAVTTEPGRVFENMPAAVRVALTGPRVPELADVVFIDGAERVRVPMDRVEDSHFVLSIERAQGPREFYVDTAEGRSERYALAVDPSPLILHASVDYEFPAYTTWPAVKNSSLGGASVEASGGAGGGSMEIRALEGTRVTVKVKSNLALGGAALVITPAKTQAKRDAEGGVAVDAGVEPKVGAGASEEAKSVTVALAPGREDASTASASFAPSFSGAFRLSIRSSRGAPGADELRGKLTVVPDAPPVVRITAPDAEVIEAPVGSRIAVKVEAEDDVSVAMVTWHASLVHPGDQVSVEPGGALAVSGIKMQTSLEMLKIEPKDGSLVRSVAAVDLGELKADAGDEVTCYASVTDNRSKEFGGPQVNESRKLVIRVITPEAYKAKAAEQRQQEKQRLEMERLDSQLRDLVQQREELAEKLDAWRKAGERGAGQRGELAEALGRYAREAERVGEALKQRGEAGAESKSRSEMDSKQSAACREVGECAGNDAREAKSLGEKLAKGSGKGDGASGGGGASVAESKAIDKFVGQGEAIADAQSGLRSAAGFTKASGGESGAGGQQPSPQLAKSGAPSNQGGPGESPDGPNQVSSDPKHQGSAEDGQAIGAERLNPESAAGRSAAPGSMSGVPARYRATAEAYFKRLAEESR